MTSSAASHMPQVDYGSSRIAWPMTGQPFDGVELQQRKMTGHPAETDLPRKDQRPMGPMGVARSSPALLAQCRHLLHSTELR